MGVTMRSCFHDHAELVLNTLGATGFLGLGTFSGYMSYELIRQTVIQSKIQEVCCPILTNPLCQQILSTLKESPECGVNLGFRISLGVFSGVVALGCLGGAVFICCRTRPNPIEVAKRWIEGCGRRCGYEEIHEPATTEV